jgi:SAM-dependent methyltransferase
MLAQAEAVLDGRARLEQAWAEGLPFADREFDAVLATTSFDHWSDQPTGLAECARVLRPDGELMIADLFAGWLAITARPGPRGRARTPKRMGRLLAAAGLEVRGWRVLERLGPLAVIRVVCAVKPPTPLP